MIVTIIIRTTNTISINITIANKKDGEDVEKAPLVLMAVGPQPDALDDMKARRVKGLWVWVWGLGLKVLGFRF